MNSGKTAVVVNGCRGDYEKQARQLYSFLKRNGLRAGLTVLLSDDPTAEQKILDSVWTEKAVVIRVEEYFAQTAAELLQQPLEGCELVLFPGNIFGTEVSARLACRMHAGHFNGVTGLSVKDGDLSATRMVYSNLASADYVIDAFPFVCSIAAEPETESPLREAPPACTVLDCADRPAPEGVVSCSYSRSAEPSTIEDARLAFVFGRGVQSEELLRQGEELAQALGAEYGVTRPVAMNGWTPLSRIVGVSGSLIHPEVCLVLGSSGASAFYAGIEHSGTIINVNTDESENLLDRSDLLIVGDCGEVLGAIQKELAESGRKGNRQ